MRFLLLYALVCQISGKDFQLPGTLLRTKYEDAFEPGLPYPYLSDPYEAQEEMRKREKIYLDSRILFASFVPPGVTRLQDIPTKSLQEETMNTLNELILQVVKNRCPVGLVETSIGIHINDVVHRFDPESIPSLLSFKRKGLWLIHLQSKQSSTPPGYRLIKIIIISKFFCDAANTIFRWLSDL